MSPAVSPDPNRSESPSQGRPESEAEPEPQFGENPGFLRDLGRFMLENKKWWLVPIVSVLLLMGILIVLGGTSAAPFIYTLF